MLILAFIATTGKSRLHRCGDRLFSRWLQIWRQILRAANFCLVDHRRVDVFLSLRAKWFVTERLAIL